MQTVDRPKDFYTEKPGWNLDVDFSPNADFRVVQITPPGSKCSITIGKGLTDAPAGSYRGTHLVVKDITQAREQLVGSGVEVGDIRHMGAEGWQPGVDPSHGDYASFADFSEPDGNTWILQEVPVGKGE